MHQTSFEVSRREGDRWVTAGIFGHRNDALNCAKRAQRTVVVRVTQELLDPTSGQFKSVVIYDSRKAPAADAPRGDDAERSAKAKTSPAPRPGFVERVVAAVTGRPRSAA